MKKAFLILFSPLLFVDFAGAYNCGTVNSRFDSFQTKWDNHVYDSQVLEARWKNLNSQYEREVRLNDAEVWQNVHEKLSEEFNDLKEEIDRCQSQREQISEYLEEAWKYEQKIMNAKDSSEFNQSDLDNAIKYYNKAYNLMKWDNWLSMWMEKKIKNRIDELSSVRDSINDWMKTLNKLSDLEKEANKYLNSWEDEKALKLYKEIISYKPTFQYYDYSSVEKNINLLEQKKWQWNNNSGVLNTTNNTTKTDELQEAILWMYEKWLTIFNEPVSFKAHNWLRRDEAAKFFVQYAKQVMGKTPDYTYQWCKFNDLNEAWSDLKDVIVESCQLWLFQWHNGKFMPTQQLTNAQAITVFMRLLEWYKNESWTHFANNYYESAHAQWFLHDTPLDNKVYFDNYTTRWNVAKMLFRWQKS